MADRRPILYETHMHTPLCKHAEGFPAEYAEVAEGRGLAGIVVTDHNPMPDQFSWRVRMYEEEFQTFLDLVQATREKWAGRVDVRLGLECDYFPGYEGFLERQVVSAPFDYILGSVHPQLHEYRQAYSMDDPVEFQRQYFTLLAQAAETRLFDCLSHPDLVKMMTPTQWDLPRILPHIERCLDRIAATGVAMELNTSGAYKPGYAEMNPGPRILQAIRARGIPMMLGADAHTPARTGDLFGPALDLLAALGFTHIGRVLNRRREEIPIAEARASLIGAANP
jgi:histidinol-phosphatase (PHP family)